MEEDKRFLGRPRTRWEYSIRKYLKLIGVYTRDSLKVPERNEKCLRVSSSVKGNPLPAPPSGREWATSWTANVGGDRINPRMRIPLYQVPTDFLEGEWAGRGQGNFLSLGWETILEGKWTTSWPTAWIIWKRVLGDREDWKMIVEQGKCQYF